MKSVTLFHNPKAGDEKHSKDELVAFIKSYGYSCRYYSTQNENFRRFQADTDLLVVAGGDGTVGKVLKMLLTKGITNNYPIAILPLGTANNIFRSLGVNKSLSEQVQRWETARTKQFDILRTSGSVSSVGIESVGFGALTELVTREKSSRGEVSQDHQLKFTLSALRDVIVTAPARHASVVIDQIAYDGNYIWIQVLNTGSIGPNIIFSPQADPGDGKLDVVLISEEQKQEVLGVLEGKMKGIEQDFAFKVVRGTNVNITYQGTQLHIDNQFISMGQPVKLRVQIDTNVFSFLV